MNTCGISHILIDNLGHAPGGVGYIHCQRLANITMKRLFSFLYIQMDSPPGKIIRVKLAKQQVSICNRRSVPPAPITGRPRLRACTFRPDPDLAEAVTMSQRAPTGTNLNHINDGDGNRHA